MPEQSSKPTLQNREKYRFHSIKDLHIFELFKEFTEIFRSECEIISLKVL